VSVQSWSKDQGFDYQLTGDESFRLCGEDYLAAVGDNVRSITNLLRLLLVREAHQEGCDRAIWIDADIFIFAPEKLRIALDSRYGFAREVWIAPLRDGYWKAQTGVNNSVFACMKDEPDLEWLIHTLRHVARHRRIKTNYQVGGDIIKGMRTSLDFQVLEHIGMFSPAVVLSLAKEWEAPVRAQARYHGAPVYAANLCAGAQYDSVVNAEDALAAVDALERTHGEIVNRWMAEGALKAQAWPGFTRFRILPGVKHQ
jgi:hypothetical protein